MMQRSFKRIVIALATILFTAWVDFAIGSTMVIDCGRSTELLLAGWDLGGTIAQEARSSTQPAGRKFDTKTKGSICSITSPFFSFAITNIELNAWGNSIGSNSVMRVYGRQFNTDPWQLLFERSNLKNTLRDNQPLDKFNVPESLSCAQIKIEYQKDVGTWVLSTVSLKTNLIVAETPTNIHRETLNVTDGLMRLKWSLPQGVTQTECRVWALETQTSGELWAERFSKFPVGTRATEIKDLSKVDYFDVPGWSGTNVSYKYEGEVLLGKDGSQIGHLTTPSLAGVVCGAQRTLSLRAVAASVTSGIIPINLIRNGVTNTLTEVTISKDFNEVYPISIPQLLEGDQIEIQSITNRAGSQIRLDDVIICSSETSVGSTTQVFTNSLSTTICYTCSCEIPISTNYHWYASVRSFYGESFSEWSEPVELILGQSDPVDKVDEGASDQADIMLKTYLRSDGKYKFLWNALPGVTNTLMKVFKLEKGGGLDQIATSNILWRETFNMAPATNSSIEFAQSNGRWNEYSDWKLWGSNDFSKVKLSPIAGCIQLGTTSDVGYMTTGAIGVEGEGLSLVVKAQMHPKGEAEQLAISRVDGSEILSLGTLTVGADVTEGNISFDHALAGNESFRFETVLKSGDARILIDEIAFVRDYQPAGLMTNLYEEVLLEGKSQYVGDFPTNEQFVVQVVQWTTNDVFSSEYKLCSQESTPRDKTIYLKQVVTTSSFNVTADDLVKTNSILIYPSYATPIQFYLDTTEVTQLNCKDVTKQLSKGIYCGTNIFNRAWVMLIPERGTKTKGHTAEMRMTFETEKEIIRKFHLSCEVAQLATQNSDIQTLTFQYRVRNHDGEFGDWQTFETYDTPLNSESVDSQLESSIREIDQEIAVSVSPHQTFEIRFVSTRHDDSVAPIGVRDLNVTIYGRAHCGSVFYLR